MGNEVTEALHTFKIGSFLARVEYDDDAESPDDWGDTECFLGRLSRCRSTIGRAGFRWSRPDEDEDEDEIIVRADGGYEMDSYGDVVAYPVVYYDHGARGSSMAMALCEDDNCHGAVFVEKVSELQLLAEPWREPLARAEALVELWNQWLSGEIYMISVLDSDGEYVECIGGFWDEDEAVEEAKALAQGWHEKEQS